MGHLGAAPKYSLSYTAAGPGIIVVCTACSVPAQWYYRIAETTVLCHSCVDRLVDFHAAHGPQPAKDMVELRTRVREALQYLEMDDCEFGHPTDWQAETFEFGPYPTTEKDVTAFIKRRTHLWRYSWIINPLRAAIGLTQLRTELSPLSQPVLQE